MNLAEAVLIAAVITYCRPFKRSKSKDFADAVLDPEQIGLFDGKAGLEAILARLLGLRDQAIAHADLSHHSTEVLERTPKPVLRSSPRPNLLGGLRVDEIRPLMAHVLQYCRNKAFNLDRGNEPGTL